MKQLIALLFLVAFNSAKAQFLLNIDGETPQPFFDRSGNNDVTFAGLPVNTENAIEFPTGNDYLIIDPFVSFDLDSTWTCSFDLKVDSIMDSIYVIDWLSEDPIHMHIAYNGNRGLYFSDRLVNGGYGNLVADTVPLPSGSYVHFDVSRNGDSLFIHRDGLQTASAYFTGTLCPLGITTIGYSDDFRYGHAPFLLDNLTLTGTLLTSVNEREAVAFSIFPNPTSERLFISTSEKIHQVRVLTILGEVVLFQNKMQGISIEVSELPTGLYLLELRSEYGLSMKRFVKQ